MTDSTQLRRLHPSDNVAVALTDLHVGHALTRPDGTALTLREPVPFGHKVALEDIPAGRAVLKYGAPIGTTVERIVAGSHVHTHNLVSHRARPGADLLDAASPSEPGTPWAPPDLDGLPSAFRGYRRDDGRVGVRNHVLVLPSVFCANVAAERIAANVDGALTLRHPYGCSQLDIDRVRDVLIGLGRHPNVAAVLVVGLGCESVQADQLASAIAETGKPAEWLRIQDRGTSATVARGTEVGLHMVADAARIERRPCPVGDLVVATECGGSDATSGLVSNPILGWVADRVISAGGTVLLSETTELIGAERVLARRAVAPRVARELIETVAAVERAVLERGVDLRGAQPTPGNMAGGLTTIEDKSLGCVAKAGTAPLRGVLAYGQRPPSTGLYVMDTPGHDAESVTGMVAGGAHMVLFSTGRGTPLGAPLAPVIKVTANPRTAERMAEHIDLSLVASLTGRADPEAVGRELWRLMLDVAGGKPTAAEVLGCCELAITRAGPSV